MSMITNRGLAFSAVLVCALSVTMSCSKNSDSTGSTTTLSLNLAAAAQKALPLGTAVASGLQLNLRSAVSSSDHIGLMGYTGITWESSTDDNDSSLIVGNSGPFRLECHDGQTAAEDTVNNCPAGVERTMSNKYSSTTLIGLIYSADKYFANNVFGSSSKDTTACSMTGASALTSHTATFTGSTQFIYSVPHYDCLFSEDSTNCSWCRSPHYYLYKKTTGTTANEIYSLLGSFFQERQEQFTSTNSQVQQLYLRNGSDGKPAFMAYSLAGAGPYDGGGGWFSRVLIMLNITDSRFFIKFGSTVSAIGKGGYDTSTGAIVGGNFVVRLYDSNSLTYRYFCLTQATTGAIALSADGSACDGDTALKDYFKKFFEADTGFWSKTGTDTAKAFFGITDAEIDTDLATMGADVNRSVYTTVPTANNATQFPSGISQ